mgnify:CR=1 FL=1
MASTFFGLHIGSSALSSFQVATNTTANNIANVKTTDTPGRRLPCRQRMR